MTIKDIFDLNDDGKVSFGEGMLITSFMEANEILGLKESSYGEPRKESRRLGYLPDDAYNDDSYYDEDDYDDYDDDYDDEYDDDHYDDYDDHECRGTRREQNELPIHRDTGSRFNAEELWAMFGMDEYLKVKKSCYSCYQCIFWKADNNRYNRSAGCSRWEDVAHSFPKGMHNIDPFGDPYICESFFVNTQPPANTPKDASFQRISFSKCQLADQELLLTLKDSLTLSDFRLSPTNNETGKAVYDVYIKDERITRIESIRTKDINSKLENGQHYEIRRFEFIVYHNLKNDTYSLEALVLDLQSAPSA